MVFGLKILALTQRNPTARHARSPTVVGSSRKASGSAEAMTSQESELLPPGQELPPGTESNGQEDGAGAKRKNQSEEDAEKRSRISEAAVPLDDSLKAYVLNLEGEIDKLRSVAHAVPICMKLLELEVTTVTQTGAPLGGPGSVIESNTTPLSVPAATAPATSALSGSGTADAAAQPEKPKYHHSKPGAFNVQPNPTSAMIAARGTSAPELVASMVTHEDLPGGKCKSARPPARLRAPARRRENQRRADDGGRT